MRNFMTEHRFLLSLESYISKRQKAAVGQRWFFLKIMIRMIYLPNFKDLYNVIMEFKGSIQILLFSLLDTENDEL